MCSSLCVASVIQFCKCTWAFTVMLKVAVMWSNCPAWVMVNKRKVRSAEFVRRVGPRLWLWWMEHQLVWHRRQGEGEENNLEDPQPGTSADGGWNWGYQLGRRIIFCPLTGAAINKGCTLFYITQALHPSSGGTNKPVLLTVPGLLHHTRHITVGRTPLDEWSARRRDLYLTTLTTDKHPWPRWDSNPQSQQASGHRPTP